MTGYGGFSFSTDEKEISVEIKTLNSKFLDCNIKLPPAYRIKEVELRNLLGDILERGKVDLMVNVNYLKGQDQYNINQDAVGQYLKQIKNITEDLAINADDVLATVLRLPNAVQAPDQILDEGEWLEIKNATSEAAKKVDSFRIEEGKTLEKDVSERIKNILHLKEQVAKFDKQRAERIKERIGLKMEELLGAENYDKNRFEQEMIYYLEKLDISEEMIRLETHCKLFLDTLAKSKKGIGKKLGFISQEIGREINTIGSKANDAQIQSLVVQAKDDLEKIKEQILNVL